MKKNVKKAISFLLAILLISDCLPVGDAVFKKTPLTVFAQSAMPGDVNNDQQVTSADARLVLRAAVGLETFTAMQKKLADVNFDNDITSADARLVLRAAVGLEELKEAADEPGEEDHGKIYTRDFSPEDVVREENGFMEYVRNEILLVAAESASFEEIRALVDTVGGEIVGYIEITGDYQIAFENKTEAQLKDLIEAFKTNALIDNAMLNYVTEIEDNTTYNDSFNELLGTSWNEFTPSGRNWGLKAIKAPTAWEYTGQMSDIKIGVIDGGFETTHKDLSMTVLPDAKHNDLGGDCPGHGTHVAGIFAAKTNNKEGISGVFPNLANGSSPKAELYVVDIHSSTQKVSLLNEKEAYVELIVRNVKVINKSQGYPNNIVFAWSIGEATEMREVYKKCLSDPLGDMLYRLIDKGYDFVLTVSAGNSSCNGHKGMPLDTEGHYYNRDPNDPCGWIEDTTSIFSADACYCKCDAGYSSVEAMIDNHPDVVDRIIVVGAVKQRSSDSFVIDVCSFSNWGDRVDVLAPGKKIYSCSVASKGYYEELGGTSQAAPYVAGTAAMVWSVNNDLTGEEVKQIITSTASKPVCDRFVYFDDDILPHVDVQVKELLDAGAAVQEAVNRLDDSYTPHFEEKSYGVIATKVVDRFDERPIDDTNGDAVTGIPVEAYPIVNGMAAKDAADDDLSDIYGEVFLIAEPGDYGLRATYDGYTSASVQTYSLSRKVVYAEWLKLKKEYDVSQNETLRCKAKDIESRDPLSDVSFSITNIDTGEAFSASTDAEGKVSCTLPHGEYWVTVYKKNYVGYHAKLRVEDGRFTVIVIEEGKELSECESLTQTTASDYAVYLLKKDLTYSVITFGSYPQSVVKDDSVVSALSQTETDWVSYRYYSGNSNNGSMQPGDWMEYCDVSYNGDRYRGVRFSQYRPGSVIHGPLSAAPEQKKNGYYPGQVYWFLWEPLQWRVLDPETGLVMCEQIIDAQAFSNTLYGYYNEEDKRAYYSNDEGNANYANDYATSSIRHWLLNDFYSVAFSEDEKEQIDEPPLNNNAYRIEYSQFDSISTNDKIFLLSYNDIKYNPFLSQRRENMSGTDYAKCQGLRVDYASGNSTFWLRTPGHTSYQACAVREEDPFIETSTRFCSIGVRPAFQFESGVPYWYGQ